MVEQIVILDFGSQYTQVIARRVRECNVYSTILRYNTPAAEIAALKPSGIILSGGPSSVYAKDAPLPDKSIFKLGVPDPGHLLRRAIVRAISRRQGREGPEARIRQGHAHGERSVLRAVREPAGDRCRSGIRTATSSRKFPTASNPSPSRKIPNSRPSRTARGNFSACNFIPKSPTRRAAGRSSPISSTASAAAARTGRCAITSTRPSSEIRAQVGKEKVILGLSGGVDSSVAAALLHKAIGDQLTCIFVNNGLLRGREAEVVQEVFGRHFKIKLQYEDASKLFLTAAQGRDRPRAQTQNHRQDVHRGFSGRDEARRQGEISRAGHALSRRDRVRAHRRQSGRDDQEPSQRRRPAEEHEISTRRAAEMPVQGRSARARAGTGVAEGNRLAPAVSRPRPGRAHPGRSDARALRNFARTPTPSWSRK